MRRKKLEYSYNDGGIYYFMDMETYDMTGSRPVRSSPTALSSSRRTEECTILSYNGNVSLALSPPVLMLTLEITKTDPGFKGDTATNVTKPATVETGAEIEGASRSSTRATRSSSTPVTGDVPRARKGPITLEAQAAYIQSLKEEAKLDQQNAKERLLSELADTVQSPVSSGFAFK